nr:MAG TPA: hypothetical protein [Caudoviricetes sp.]
MNDVFVTAGCCFLIAVFGYAGLALILFIFFLRSLFKCQH